MVNILVFSSHPDDAELVIGGIIAKHSKKYKVVIVDLTKGEKSSNGGEEKRSFEALEAAKVLNIRKRINLEIKDCEVNHNSIEQEKLIIETIRNFRPSIIMAPFKTDAHPDHKEAHYLIKSAVYKAGVNIYEELGEPHNCKYLYYYAQDFNKSKKSFYMDVTDVYDLKLKAIGCYKSQFIKQEGQRYTDLNKYMLKRIKAKDSYCGSLIQSEYGEELIYEGKLVLENIFEVEKIQ